jgi:hypothetical protein
MDYAGVHAGSFLFTPGRKCPIPDSDPACVGRTLLSANGKAWLLGIGVQSFERTRLRAAPYVVLEGLAARLGIRVLSKL